MEETNYLKEILNSLKHIESLLNLVYTEIRKDKDNMDVQNVHEEPISLDIITILQDLDDNLIPTIRALMQLKNGGTADQIANITGRSRSRENQHLNKLADLNYVTKYRNGREITFKVER